MSDTFFVELARGRREELWREAEERRIARALRRARRRGGQSGGLQSVTASWEPAEEEPTIIVPLHRASRR